MKRLFKFLLFFGDYLHAKNQHMFHQCGDIFYARILQFDWSRVTKTFQQNSFLANINTSEHIRQSEGYLSGFSWCSEGSVSSLGFLHPYLIFLQSPSSKLTTRVVYFNLLWCLLFNLQSLACLKNSHFYAKHGACRTNLYFFNKINGIDIN